MLSRRYGMMMLSLAASIAMIVPPSLQIQDEPRLAPETKRELRRAPIRRQRRAPRLNRSRHWAYAETYKDARRVSPYPHRAVR